MAAVAVKGYEAAQLSLSKVQRLSDYSLLTSPCSPSVGTGMAVMTTCKPHFHSPTNMDAEDADPHTKAENQRAGEVECLDKGAEVNAKNSNHRR